MHENMEASQGSMDIVCHGMLQKSLRNKADAKRFLIDVLYQNPGPPHLEGPSNDVKYFGLCTEGGDYFVKIKELQAYLDMVCSYQIFTSSILLSLSIFFPLFLVQLFVVFLLHRSLDYCLHNGLLLSVKKSQHFIT
ncbi:hypothetical protein Dsin_016813 [Dipteronia sinensis]|uniref:Uncharacterized protein n=1 Tax=Dipteronia sinensis TaxID=43782 RepID=A0AAE0E633_9ROSI|nr:hypothetical protein Dsin_016813 [Dipteronia sinensis]